MRDLINEGHEHDRRVACADANAMAQVALVQGMALKDPRRADAQKTLFEMQALATDAEVDRAMAKFGPAVE